MNISKSVTCRYCHRGLRRIAVTSAQRMLGMGGGSPFAKGDPVVVCEYCDRYSAMSTPDTEPLEFGR